MIVVFSKDGKGLHAARSSHGDAMGIANHWRNEGGHMARESRKHVLEVRTRRTRAASDCRLSLDKQCIAIRNCQRVVANYIPRKSKSLSFRLCGTSREDYINKQVSLFSNCALRWHFAVYGRKSMT